MTEPYPERIDRPAARPEAAADAATGVKAATRSEPEAIRPHQPVEAAGTESPAEGAGSELPMEGAGSTLSVVGAGKAYRLGDASAIVALRDIGFDLVPATVTAVTGPVGSGTSTLLRLIAGLERPDAGAVLVDGERVSELAGRALAAYRRRIGVVHDRDLLLSALTLADNVRLPALPRSAEPDRRPAPLVGVAEAPRRLDPVRAPLRMAGRMAGQMAGRRVSFRRGTADTMARARELLAWVGVAEPGLRPAALSPAGRRRVVIARALMNRPALMLADDPTGGLPAPEQGPIVDLLQRVRDETGATVLIATADHEVADRCDRIIRLSDGRLVEDSGALA